MLYVICASSLHTEVADFIRGEFQSENTRVLHLPKGLGIAKSANNLLAFLACLLRIVFDTKSHVFVPHIFSPWFSIMARVARKISIYDDGVMYYGNFKIRQSFLCYLYISISNTIGRKILSSELSSMSYLDFIANSNIEYFYCFFPEQICAVKGRKIQLVPRTPPTRKSFSVIYLDTSDSVLANPEDKIKILIHLERLAEQYGQIAFKEHPRHSSYISRELRTKQWATEISGDYERIIKEHLFEIMISVYSSAVITTRILSPHTKLVCFTNNQLREECGSIHGLFVDLGVHFISSSDI